MRALEIGLRAFAEHILPADAIKELILESWNKVIEKIEKEISNIEKRTKSVEKNEMLRIYSDAASQFQIS
jgi:Mg2+ and Co2+ transporter CorA